MHTVHHTPIGSGKPDADPRADGSRSARPSDVVVGRHDELRILAAARAGAAQGRPRLVWIEGEAGMGKTALLRQAGLLQTGRSEHPSVLACADASETTLRWGVATQLLQGGTRRRPSPAPATDPIAVGADLLAMFDDLQQCTPGIVVVEDVHQCDPPSAQALLFALRRLHTVEQLLVVLTARPDAIERLGESWQRLRDDPARTTTIVLGGLGPAHVVELARAMGIDPLATTVAERIAQHTAGHPLYIRTLLEDVPMSVLAGPPATLPVPRSLATVFLARLHQLSQPAQQLVMASAVVGRPLAPATLHRIATVPGTGVVPSAGADDPTGQFHQHLQEVLASGLVLDHPDGQMACRHPLVQAAVVGDLPAATRAALHRQAAAVLDGTERLSHLVAARNEPDTTLADELCHEAARRRRVGAYDEAADLFLLAAEATHGAEADAALLAAAETLVVGGDRLRASTLAERVAATAPSPRRDYLLGCCAFIHGRSEDARRHLLAALAGEATDPRTAGRAAATLALADLGRGVVANVLALGHRAATLAADDDEQSAEATTVLALGLAMNGEHDQARRQLSTWIDRHRATVAAHALTADHNQAADQGQLADASDIDAVLTDAPAHIPGLVDLVVTKGIVELAAGWTRPAAVTLRQAVAAVRLGAPGTLGVQALSYLAETEFRLGRWDDAQLHADLAASVAHDTETVWSYAAAHAVASRIHAWRGDSSSAKDHQEQAQDAARRYPTWSAVAWAAAATATFHLLTGNPHEAVVALEPAFDPPTSTCLDGVGAEPWLALRADAQVSAGLTDQATDTLARLDARIAERQARLHQADHAQLDLYRLRAVLADRRGDAETAQAIVERGLELRAGMADASLAAARLELTAAQLQRQWKHRRAAIDLLEDARRGFQRLGCRSQLQLVNEELRRCGVPAATTRTPVGLTPQEQAVAHLAAGGHTNRAIAAELFVSVKAVEYHLGNLYAKLGIHTRQQLRQALDPDDSA
jgi:DNA-binding NarL/FixJ family response regulator